MGKMKKKVKILIIVAIVLIIAGVTVWAATMGKANSSYVRIREKATTESEVLDVLMEGDQVEILSEEGDWYKVKAKGHTGYVSKAFITKGETTATANDNNNTTNNDNNTTTNTDNNLNVTTNNNATKTATITTRIYKVAEGTNVYILPLLSSNTIGTVNAGESLDLINSAGLWGYIKTNNIKGWVRIDKLSSEEVQTTVPAEQVPEEAKSAEEQKQEEAKPAEEPKQEEAKQEETKQEETKPAEEPKQEEAKQEEAKQEETKQEETKPAETPIQEKTMYVCVTAINVRAEPNTTSEVISGAELNGGFVVVAEVDGWYKVKVNGNNFGYIRKDLLSDKKTEETSRGTDADRTSAVKQNKTENNVSNTQTTTNTQATTNTQQDAKAQTPVATTQATTASQATATTATATTQPAKSNAVTGEQVAEYAKQFLGCSYVYAAAGPSSFDCSGLTMYVYKHFGYNLSHSSKVQATQGTKVTGDLKPGDILVFSNDGKQVGHVGLYLGNDKFIHASDYSTGVIISNLHDSWNIKKYWGARRIIQ